MTGNEQKAAPKRNYFGRDRFVALIVLAGFLAFRIIDPAPVKILRLKSFDLYQQMKPRPVPPKSPVVIIDIDEASLAEIGQWPWPRNIHAQIVQNLMQMGAAIVAFDAVFAEPDRMNPSGAAPSVPSNDQVFARAMRSHGRVVIGQGATSKPSEENRRPQRAVTIHIVKDGPDPIAWIPEVPALVRNIPVIEDAATGIGSFTLMPESDGIIRRIPTVLRVSKKLYPSLAVEILRVAFQSKRVMVMTDAAGISEVGFLGKGADIKIKTDRNGLIWPYFSKSDMTKYVSARDVLSGTADPALIKGKLTIVGTSAAGLLEIRATPVDPVIPGVEIHAQLIEAILHQTYLSRPSNVEGAELALIVIVGLLMIWLIPRVTARLSLMAPLLVAASLIGFSWYSFVAERILLDVSFAILTILVLTLFLTYTAYVRAAKLVRIVRESGSPAGAEDIQGPRAEAGKAPSSAASIQSEDIETVYATRRPQGSVDRQIVSGSYLLVPLAILLGLIVIFFVVVVTTCSNV